MKSSLIVLSLCLIQPIFADSTHAPINLSTSASAIGSAKLSTLNLPITSKEKFGVGYFYQSPKNEEQKLINQGYSALNVFHYVDAYRSFKTAFDLNPSSSMALVGMNFSVLLQDTSDGAAKLAASALNGVETIKEHNPLNLKEEGWFDFAKAFYLSKIGNDRHLTIKTSVPLSQAFQALMANDGSNLEAKTFIHWILLNSQNVEYIKNILEEVVAMEPTHAGAQHYLLHIAEMFDDIPLAQTYGRALIQLAKGSAHAQHMFGHTLPQTGQWQEALNQFLIADSIHMDWARKNGVELSEDWHYAHNLDLMAATYLGLKDYTNALINWSKAMSLDARAIRKTIGLSLALNQLDEAAEVLTQIEAIGPQYRQFVRDLREEHSFLANKVTPTQFGSGELAPLIRKIFASDASAQEGTLSKSFENYFVNVFRSGGFDGWSNGFVDLMRVQNLAKTKKLMILSSDLEELMVKAREGRI
ncbi:MAG: hypothetical protein K9K67_15420 [Bacteriovoracaceae bacterium]|nr:hypothetical protein [Bacteriovoracaceae bacterium]